MIKEQISGIRERISSICSLIDKDPDSVTLVAVSKGRPSEQIKEVILAGINNIGENKVQEALFKINQLRSTSYEPPTANRQPPAAKWHMVGHLQTNKAREAVRIFDLIHSVDSFKLAREIDKEAAKINKIQDILVEVNASGEITKFGLKPDEAIGVIKQIIELKNINIKGLMTIAPLLGDSEKARPYFRILRELLVKVNYELKTINYELKTLSMGMTDDFQVAIEEGSNMVRLGRAIFEG